MTHSPVYHSTVSAPTNIAVIKYWGKANVDLNTPLNDSLSVTLDQRGLRAVTTVAASFMFTRNRLWINGVEIEEPNSRFEAVIKQMKALAQDTDVTLSPPDGNANDNNATTHHVTASAWRNMNVHVSSYNTFPTAAGLASSAAGYAALVFGLATLYKAKEKFVGHFSAIARQGSGSACRSLYGGFVAWRQGSGEPDRLNVTSIADPIAPDSHWPLHGIILVVSSRPKHTSSTIGMQTSVATSSLLQYRASNVVPQRIKQMEEAIRKKDFNTFATLTMQDSNQFHAICLDTYPPICYLSDISKIIIQLITDYNQRVGEIRCAYTFDAGPNAVLYLQPQHLLEVSALVARAFGVSLFQEFRTSIEDGRSPIDVDEIEKYTGDALSGVSFVGGVERVYVTSVGPGPQVVSDVCNVDVSTGLNTYK
jgi:diphosphomevalonate decarboxylase